MVRHRAAQWKRFRFPRGWFRACRSCAMGALAWTWSGEWWSKVCSAICRRRAALRVTCAPPAPSPARAARSGRVPAHRHSCRASSLSTCAAAWTRPLDHQPRARRLHRRLRPARLLVALRAGPTASRRRGCTRRVESSAPRFRKQEARRCRLRRACLATGAERTVPSCTSGAGRRVARNAC